MNGEVCKKCGCKVFDLIAHDLMCDDLLKERLIKEENNELRARLKSVAHVRNTGRVWKAACKEFKRRCAHNAKYARQISGVTQRLELAMRKNERLTTENTELRARLKNAEVEGVK